MKAQEPQSLGDGAEGATVETDVFDKWRIKSSYPKVTINLLGNLHQDKAIEYVEEGQEGQTTEDQQI